MTTALYRRYRPETFAEVIGQEHVTEPLMQALRTDRVTHAYLFSGPRGCGKTTSARILARCLNCAQGPTPTPCGECESCVELSRGGPGSLDVVEIDAASHGGVDDARDLRERATFAPARDRYKIFILDEAHMVTSQGFNALLKIVEEPPPHIKFVFATTEPDKVIGTIRSRTHHYPFRLVPPDVLMPYLEQVCEAEGVPVGAGVLPLVVRAGGGSVRDSLSVLDQLVAGADEGGLDYERAVALLGYTHAALLDDAVEAIAAGDGASAFRVVERVISTGHEPRRFVEDLLERLRDLIVLAASGDAARAALRDVPADQFERMRSQASQLGAAELSRSADLVNEALTEMTGATSPRLHLELLVARLLLPTVDDDARGLGARVERLERRVTDGVVAAPAHGAAPVAPATPAVPARDVPAAPPAVAEAPAEAHGSTAAAPPARGTDGRADEPADTPGEVTHAEERVEAQEEAGGAPSAEPAATEPPVTEPPVQRAVPAPQPAAPPQQPAAQPAAAPASSGGIDAETVRRRWPEVLQTLRGLRMATWVLVSQNAHVTGVADGALSLAFSTPQLATTFRSGSHADNVRRALHETLGLDVRVETVLGEDGPAATAPSAPASGGAPAATWSVDTRRAAASWDEPAAPAGQPSERQGRAPDAGGSERQGPAPDAGGPPAGGPSRGHAQGGGGPTTGADASRGDAPAARTAASPSSAPPWDEPPPEDPGPPEDVDRGGGHPTGRAAARPTAPARGPRYDDGEDADPDDPDIASTGLVGAPLVAQMLGGTVIDEIPEENA